jgi:hypothetical protein
MCVSFFSEKLLKWSFTGELASGISSKNNQECLPPHLKDGSLNKCENIPVV